MRPIEKRIAVVEARIAPAKTGNFLVFFQPEDADPTAFEQECRAKAAGADFSVVVFVRKRADGTWDV